MKRMILAGVVALMCAGGAAGAQEGANPSAAEIVAARQAAMAMSGVTMGSLKAALDAGAAPQSMAFAAGALTRWAAALPGMFPAGTGPGVVPTTKAKAETWTDWAGYEAKAGDYTAAAARLQELIAAGDNAGALEQFMVVRASCQSCHDAYRS